MSEPFKQMNKLDKYFVLGKILQYTVLIITVSITSFGFISGHVQEWFQRQAQMQVDITDLIENQQILLGNRRIFREVTGLTYVEEPVCEGEQVTYHIVAERTAYGAQHTLVTAVPHFTDRRNGQFMGQAVQATRQLPQAQTPISATFDLNPDLRPGRIAMFLQLEYIAPNGERVFETTSRASFILLSQGHPDCE